MGTKTGFPAGVGEAIKFYVYMLSDPRTEPPTPVYVGKGVGNRIFAHLNQALESPTESDKLDQIRSIVASGKAVGHRFLRHGLDSEKVAYEIESAFIDYLSLGIGNELTNLSGGHGARYRGLMTVEEAIAEYSAAEVTIEEPVILIKINRKFRRGMSDTQLYEATRQSWVVNSKNAARGKYAFSVAFGIIRQVYLIENWYLVDEVSKRCAFMGSIAPEMSHYIGGSVAKFFDSGAQNPIRYLNCKKESSKGNPRR